MKRVRILALVGVVALVSAACGSSETTSDLPGDTQPAAGLPLDTGGGGDDSDAATCLADEPVCEDTFPDSGEPTEVPSPGVPVATVVGTSIDGGFVIAGFYVADANGVRLCEALAESFPPQCGGASIIFDNTAGAALGPLSIEQGVSWSEQPILVEGSVVDGVFVAS